MKVDPGTFKVRAGLKVRLDAWPTRVKDCYRSKEDYHTILGEHIQALQERQDLLYATSGHALLLIIQGMDAAGKDGIIKHVMSGVNPQGVEVTSFKQPSTEELKHDFLWRTTRCLPERGRIGIFNRSYYEEVLVVRVHPELLLRQGLPAGLLEGKRLWKDRYRSIRDLEDHLGRNGTVIIKIFLHLSRDEQRKRLLARIDDPAKNWKFSAADLQERKAWKKYMAAYGACLAGTSTAKAPWYIVPADDKRNARLIVSRIILDTLDGLGLARPEADRARLRELKALRRRL